MTNSFIDEPMLEAYVFETSQILENLEQVMITSEKSGGFTQDAINEIFRFMHTIKGSSAMMMFTHISQLAHHLEDVFYVIRENQEVTYDFTILVDLILESIDFFKLELVKIRQGDQPDGNSEELLSKVSQYLDGIKQEEPKKDLGTKQKEYKPKDQKYYIGSQKQAEKLGFYEARIFFKPDCEMENIRAYTIVHNITNFVDEVVYEPKNIIEDDDSIGVIKEVGFFLSIKTLKDKEQIQAFLNETIFLDRLEFASITQEVYNQRQQAFNNMVEDEIVKIPKSSKKYQQQQDRPDRQDRQETSISTKQSIISVNVDKLDRLMDMVGELVIAEAMVTQNPDVVDLELESFEKASRQLHKITGELQDMVMAIRMVPLSTTFMKMHRIVRDMTRKLEKDIELVVYGEETEVDKNIIEKIADPLMHIIRNAIDHGIESESDRLVAGKSGKGKIILEAKNSGSDVLIIIKDDGKGLDKERIYQKAILNGLINKEIEEMSEREIYHLILQPGFSTKDEVTEFSGRGVGMDVVTKNIESVGGTVVVESRLGYGTTIILKIPLTLAIIEGMNIRVGQSRFTIPIVSIKESFRASNSEIITDTEGEEMIMVRGACYPVLRLHKIYGIDTRVKTCEEGILIMVEEDDKGCCIFADELIGQQQVVVKALPEYVKKFKDIKGLGGCTLLGDGSISLIIDVGDFNLVTGGVIV